MSKQESNTKRFVRFSKKEKVSYTKKILELYEEGEYTLSSCCEAVGIDPARFFRWKQPNCRHYVAEVLDLFNESKAKRDHVFRSKLKDSARVGLLRLIKGHSYEEVHKETKIDPETKEEKVVATKTITKFIQPNPTAVIFALKNVDSANFKEELENKITLTREGNLTDEELDAEIRALESKG